jgi:hypothetical protein
MTFDDDFVRLPMAILDSHINVPLVRLGLEWPPPEEFTYSGLIYRQIRCSEITDEQREGMTNVIRGAEYEYVGMDPNYPEESS